MARRRTTPVDRSAVTKRVASQIMRASEMDPRFIALIYGRSGAGKTRLASSAPSPLLIDVNEKGTDSVRRDWDPLVYPVTRWAELSDVYWYLQEGEHEHQTCILDSLTAMQDLCMKFVLGDETSRDASRDPDMPDRRVWNKISELMKTQINNYRNLPMNVIFTATDRKRIIGDEDDEDQEITTGPALSPAVAGAAERAVGLLAYLHKRQVLIKSKGKKATKTVVRRRLLIDDPTERYQTKDRYHFGVPYIDAPDISTMLRALREAEEK